MPDNNINREYKDTLFKLIFGEHKKYALALYNAVNHTDYTDESELVVKTLRDALYVDVKNDVGYVFHDIMNLIEHQASFNPNMPLRGLGYFADMYKEYISEAFRASSVLYSEKLVHLPTPRYFVLYNGIREMQDDLDLKLSDAYDNKGDIEVIAHMLNINKGHNKTLLEACRPLKDYAELIDRIRGQKAQGCTNEEAVSTAMNSCIEDGVLEEFLRKERDKVENILIRGLTEEEKKEVERINQEYYKEQGLKQGLEEGRTLTKLEDVDKLVASGVLDPIKACEILGVSYDEYKNRPDQ